MTDADQKQLSWRDFMPLRYRSSRWFMGVALVLSAIGALIYGPTSASMVALVINGFLWLALLITAPGRRRLRSDTEEPPNA